MQHLQHLQHLGHQQEHVFIFINQRNLSMNLICKSESEKCERSNLTGDDCLDRFVFKILQTFPRERMNKHMETRETHVMKRRQNMLETFFKNQRSWKL